METIHTPIQVSILEDDPSFIGPAAEGLTSLGYQSIIHHSLEEFLEGSHHASILICNIELAQLAGPELLLSLADAGYRCPTILLTRFSNSASAIEAIRKGAFDYLVKPVHREELFERVEQAVESLGFDGGPPAIADAEVSDALVGKCRAMQAVFKEVGRVADRNIPVLILGETGTGKELIAHAIHRHGSRNEQPFVALNCSAIPDGLLESELFGHEKGAFTGATSTRIGRFQQADGGTLFLDEIGDMAPQTQVKLLRVLQERKIRRVGGERDIPVDVRILSATHRDLAARIDENLFREDLYYRLNGTTILLPPVRERREDIALLVDYFVARCARGFSMPRPVVTPGAMALLEGAAWPGNVRQLEHSVVRLVVEAGSGPITETSVRRLLGIQATKVTNHPAAASGVEPAVRSLHEHAAVWLDTARQLEVPGGVWDPMLRELEAEALRIAWERARGNQSQIARWLGLSRITVRERLVRHGILPSKNLDEV